MFNKMKNKGMLLVCSLSVFIISVCFINFLERQNCMNVPIQKREGGLIKVRPATGKQKRVAAGP